MQSETLHTSPQVVSTRRQQGTRVPTSALPTPRTKALIWITLLALIALEVYTRDPWLVLAIPGTILMGYGLLAKKYTKIALRKRSGSALN